MKYEKLEKRTQNLIEDYEKLKKKGYKVSFENKDELKENLINQKNNIISSLKENKIITPVIKRIDWEKCAAFYDTGLNILLDEIGLDWMKESEYVVKVINLEESERGEKLPEIIEEVYGSLDNYINYGSSMKESSKKVKNLLEEIKFSFIEKCTVKKFCQKFVNGLEDIGQEIIEAGEEANSTKE